jgi:hypothetical protein
MKLFLSTIILLSVFTFNTSFAQTTQAEKVYSIIKVYKTYEWYVEQHGLWEKELKKDKKNREIWENLYASARMAKIMSPETENRDQWVNKMEDVIQKMEKTIPNTYEYYHLKSWHSSIWAASPEEAKEIGNWAEKAYAIDPDRAEIYPDLMNLFMITGDTLKMKELSKKWLLSGDLSPNLLALTYNMLNSTDKNATLLTAGDNDTYPALVLQYGKGIRTDVTVINIFCAYGSKAYRDQQFNKSQIPTAETEVKNQLDVVHHVVENRGNNPLFFAYGNYLNEDSLLSQNMYNVGLALRYSEESFNNTSDVINNFENKFLLDHLTFSTFNEEFPEQVKRHNLAYLPGLFTLYKHYATVQDARKKEEIKALIEIIAIGTSYEITANEIFTKC